MVAQEAEASSLERKNPQTATNKKEPQHGSDCCGFFHMREASGDPREVWGLSPDNRSKFSSLRTQAQT